MPAFFQGASLRTAMALGIPGEMAYDGPVRAKAFQLSLNSQAGAAHIIGATWYTLSTALDGVAWPGGAAANPLGGLLVNPKAYASYGASAPLANVGIGPIIGTMTLPDGTIGELATMGCFFVRLITACQPGSALNYNTTTGAIDAGAPGGGQVVMPNAKVILHAVAAGGVGIIELTN